MSITQFLRIFWARRMTVVIATVMALIGSVIVAQLLPPRYDARALVSIDIVRRDVVTGEALAGSAGAYFEGLSQLIKDYSVTGPVVDRMGWLSDPTRIAAYSQRAKDDTRDFRRWLADGLADDTQAWFEGTTLIIMYQGSEAQTVRDVADALRETFLKVSVDRRRNEAMEDARWYTDQAETARKAAEEAELAKAAYERQTGIIMEGGSDLDTNRLAALAGASTFTAASGAAAAQLSPGALQLAQLDAEIAQAGQRLGPNHPEMQALRARRETVAAVAAQEATAMRNAASGVSTQAIVERQLQAQKARVLSQRDKVERLRQLQAEVDLRREQYRTAAARSAQFLQESSVATNNMKPLGIVLAPTSPSFPQKKLIVIGAVALGALLGLAISLLLELLNRRVRGVEDLNLSSDIHCIGVVEQPLPGDAKQTLRKMFKNAFARKQAGAPA